MELSIELMDGLSEEEIEQVIDEIFSISHVFSAIKVAQQADAANATKWDMSHMDKDITHLVKFQDNDGECLPLTQCVCGAKFPAWDFVLNIYRDMAHECRHCGRRLYFSNNVRVFEVDNGITENAPESPLLKEGDERCLRT